MDKEGGSSYMVSEAVLYLIGNGIDPREVDRDIIDQIQSDLRENPCEIRTGINHAEIGTTDSIVLPENGRARELLDNFFGIRGITPEEAPPVILGMAAKIAHKIVQQESVLRMDIEVNPDSNMQSGTEYIL